MIALRLAVATALIAPSPAFCQVVSSVKAPATSVGTGLPTINNAVLSPSISFSPLSPLTGGISVSAAPSINSFSVLPPPSVQAAATPALSAVSVKASVVSASPLAQLTAASVPSSPNDGAPAESAASPMFDGAMTAYILEDGFAPVKTTIAELGAAVAARPGLAARLKKNGRARVVVGLGAQPDAKAYGAALRAAGVDAPVIVEKLLVAEPKKPSEGAGDGVEAPKSSGRRVVDALLWPAREAAYLARTLKASYTKPLWSEILGGIATKSFPLVASIGVFWATVGLAHPIALTALVLMAVGQEVFHGVFLNTWNNFQDNISRRRGFSYQMFFNLAYMQGFGALYRFFSWTANPGKVVPPWSPLYWKDMILTSVVGTFFGTLGFNGLNSLYAKGAISRWQRSGIQQVRDMFFLLAGPFFATGSMTAFWTLFAVQQLLDLGLAVWAARAKTRPVVYLADAELAATPDFAAKYPVSGAPEASPLKQAWEAMTGNPLIRLATWPARAVWKLVKGGKK